MDKDFIPVRSVYNSNYEVIKNIMALYKIEQFDLDCTYSRGLFWKNLPRPKIKTDLVPVTEDTIQANSEHLPFENNSLKSIMCDLPFVICGKQYKSNKEGSSVIAKRFEGYPTFKDLKKNYYGTLKELYRVCDKDGFVVFKCQDSVSGGLNYFTHIMVLNMALEIGYYPRDLFVLVTKQRINSFGAKWSKQEHARKHHSFYWILEKKISKKDFNFYKISE
jgi:hypothetical protein